MLFWQQSKITMTRLSHYLAKPHILFYALPWLMVLLVLGTVAQKDMGLYAATEKYFNSIILWLGPIPTPGGLTTIGLILLALSIKFIFFSPWRWEKVGTILTHLGVLILLIGGLITSMNAREGFMIIPEGKDVNFISDYHQRVLNVSRNGESIKVIPFETIVQGQRLSIDDLEFEVLLKCNNCDAKAPSGKYENLKGLAENMELFTVPNEKNIEANFSGLILELVKGNLQQTGTYIVMEDIPKTPEFKAEGGDITLNLERAKEPLPFTIALNDFRKIDYPGTIKAREFESDLVITDGDLEWPATISMNKPLRYKGYVFYQSSFEQRKNLEVTVLSVVQNSGRIFPYIATFIIFIGLLLHFMIRLQKSYKERKA